MEREELAGEREETKSEEREEENEAVQSIEDGENESKRQQSRVIVASALGAEKMIEDHLERMKATM